MPTPTFVNAANMIKGVVSAEASINIGGFDQDWSDEKLYIENKSGSPTGFVHNFMVASTCTITGETNTALLTGIAGVAFGVAQTIANSIAGYGVSAGGWYMDTISLSTQRSALATATIAFTRHPDIT